MRLAKENTPPPPYIPPLLSFFLLSLFVGRQKEENLYLFNHNTCFESLLPLPFSAHCGAEETLQPLSSSPFFSFPRGLSGSIEEQLPILLFSLS